MYSLIEALSLLLWLTTNQDEFYYEGVFNKPETQIEEPKKEIIYTKNITEESIKNRSYNVRKDGFIPLYNEPFSFDDPFYLSLYGNRVWAFKVYLSKEIMPEKVREILKKDIPEEVYIYNVIDIKATTAQDNFTLYFKVDEFTPHKNEEIFDKLKNINIFESVNRSNVLLPEYNSKKHIDYLYSLTED